MLERRLGQRKIYLHKAHASHRMNLATVPPGSDQILGHSTAGLQVQHMNPMQTMALFLNLALSRSLGWTSKALKLKGKCGGWGGGGAWGAWRHIFGRRCKGAHAYGPRRKSLPLRLHYSQPEYSAHTAYSIQVNGTKL